MILKKCGFWVEVMGFWDLRRNRKRRGWRWNWVKCDLIHVCGSRQNAGDGSTVPADMHWPSHFLRSHSLPKYCLLFCLTWIKFFDNFYILLSNSEKKKKKKNHFLVFLVQIHMRESEGAEEEWKGEGSRWEDI